MIGIVEGWAPPAVLWLATYAIHSTLLLSGAYLIGRILRAYPHLVSTVWKSALVGGVLTATIQVAFGVHPLAGRLQFGGPESQARPLGEIAMPSATHIDLPAPKLRRYAGVGPQLQALPPPTSAPAEPMAEDVGPCQGGIVPVPQTGGPDAPGPHATRSGSVPSTTSVSTVAAESGGWWSSAWVSWLAIAWIALASLGLLGLVGTVLALRRQLALAHDRVDASLRGLFDRLCASAGMSSRVALRVSSAVSIPLAAGVLRPCIYVPRRVIHDLDTAAQESLLAHELGHVVRRDPLWRLLGLAIERVFFFQPLNRLANRELAAQSELLADEWAAMRTRAPLALAQCLTEVAAWLPSQRLGVVPTMAGLGGRPSMLARRVTRLVERPASFGRAVVPWWGMPAAAMLFGASAWVIPGVSHGEMHGPACQQGVVVVASDIAGAGARLVVVPVIEHPDRADRADRASHRDAAPEPTRAEIRKDERAIAKQRRVAKRNIAREFRRARKEGRLPSAAELARHGVRDRVAPGSHANEPARLAFEIDGSAVVVIGPEGLNIEDQAEFERAIELQLRGSASEEERERARKLGKKAERRARARAKADEAAARAHSREFERHVDQALRSLEQSQELSVEQWRALEAMMRSASEVDWPSVYRRMLEIQRHRLQWQQRELERRIERGHARGGRAQTWPGPADTMQIDAAAAFGPLEGGMPGLSLIAPVEPAEPIEATERCRT